HAVARGNRILSNKGSLLRLQDISGNTDPIDWVGAIADSYLFVQSSGSSHEICHRISEGIDPTSDILHIKDQDIDVFQHGVGRFTSLAVKRVNRESSHTVYRVRSLNHI